MQDVSKRAGSHMRGGGTGGGACVCPANAVSFFNQAGALAEPSVSGDSGGPSSLAFAMIPVDSALTCSSIVRLLDVS